MFLHSYFIDNKFVAQLCSTEEHISIITEQDWLKNMAAVDQKGGAQQETGQVDWLTQVVLKETWLKSSTVAWIHTSLVCIQ